MNPYTFLYNIDTNYTISKHTGEFGVIKCKEIFHRIGWIPREINQQDDVGIDLIVETTNIDSKGNYIPLGQLFGIQIKAGASYYYENKKGKNYFILTSSKEHRRNWDYWCKHQLPVFIFFYYDNLKFYSFFNINKWAISEEDWDNNQPLPIKSYQIFKLNNKNNSENFIHIKEEILKSVSEKGELSNIISLIDSIYYDDSKALESLMLLSRNYKTRGSTILALLFPHILLSEKDDAVREAFKYLIEWIDTLSWLPDHMENIKKLYRKILNNLTIEIWERVLSVVENHEFYSIDPGFDTCMCPIPDSLLFPTELDDFKSLFLKIAKDEKIADYTRINALALYLFGSFVVNYYINNDDYSQEWEEYNRDFLDWKGIHIKDYFLEKEIKSFLIKNNLLKLVANYYNIFFPESGNKKMNGYLK